jgi:guanylate kinase
LTPLVLVLTGPSGVGKDWLLDNLVMRRPALRRAKTATTRAPRGPHEGQHYHFWTPAKFRERVAQGRMLEYAGYVKKRYGVPVEEVLPFLQAGISVGVRTEVVGARALQDLLRHTVVVFVAPQSMDELRWRIEKRAKETGTAMTPDELDARMATAEKEMESQDEFDYKLINPDGRQGKTLSDLIAIADRELEKRA